VERLRVRAPARAARQLTVAAALLLAAVPAASAPAGAQPAAGKVYRIGWLRPGGTAAPGHPFAERLGELGYVAGRNLVIEHRVAGGQLERLVGFATELVALRVDVIVATSVAAVQAARKTTKTIPVVMAFAPDPVENQLVASLARPGGNVTGVSYGAGKELAGKRIELLREMVPRATRIAVLTTAEPSARAQIAVAEQTARSLRARLLVVEVKDRRYEEAFVAMADQRAEALFVVASSILNDDRGRIVELAARYRIPAMYEWREMVDEGGLMSYGGNQRALFRRVAEYVDRLLAGANPAELPVEQWSSFELAVNLTTAKALGLRVPRAIQARADHLIE
jgi:putative ABC transport system substrate-binding protein